MVLGHEGGGPHHMQGRSGFDCENSSNIQWRLKILSLSLYLC